MTVLAREPSNASVQKRRRSPGFQTLHENPRHIYLIDLQLLIFLDSFLDTPPPAAASSLHCYNITKFPTNANKKKAPFSRCPPAELAFNIPLTECNRRTFRTHRTLRDSLSLQGIRQHNPKPLARPPQRCSHSRQRTDFP